MSQTEQSELEVVDAVPSSELVTFDTIPAAKHNFDGDDMHQWRMSALATGGGCRPGSEILEKPFPLRYYFIHTVMVKQDDGAQKPCIRTVLMDENGSGYGFVSQGVFEGLKLIVSMLGDKDENWPVSIVVRQQDRKGGHKFNWIEPAPTRYEPQDKEAG